MKKTSLLLIILLVITFGFSSCKKCYVCDFGKDGTRELCSKDFPDGTDGLMLTINDYEKQGYSCTKK